MFWAIRYLLYINDFLNWSLNNVQCLKQKNIFLEKQKTKNVLSFWRKISLLSYHCHNYKSLQERLQCTKQKDCKAHISQTWLNLLMGLSYESSAKNLGRGVLEAAFYFYFSSHPRPAPLFCFFKKSLTQIDPYLTP